MSKSLGWAGAVLDVDLSGGKVERMPLDKDFARRFIGASGFNTMRLFEMVATDTDALSPENVMLLAVGPVTGTLAPGSSRITMSAKSPLTDIFGDANMGGHFGTELKFAGLDQIIIRGKADRPVYLWIDGDKVEIRDASHLWGKSTWDTSHLVCDELGDPGLHVACIGQAGENLVRFANVMVPTKRAAGRTGMGAVMGSKNLKAIAVRGGSNAVGIARPEEFLAAINEMRETVKDSYHFYNALHNYGTPGFTEIAYPKGGLIVKYYDRATFQNWEAISGESFKKQHFKSMRGCTGCQIACGPFSYVSSGEYAGTYGEGPEYAHIGRAIMMEIDNAAALQKINELTNQLGIDILSVCGIMAWAMACYDQEILKRSDFDGLPLRFGDYKAAIEMIPKIANREGFGAILAEGEKRAPGLLGRGSDKLMYNVKGMMPVSHDPRSNKGFGAGYLASSRGGDHLKACVFDMRYLLRNTELGEAMGKETFNVTSPAGVGKVVRHCEDMKQVVDSMGMCTRTSGSVELLTKLMCSATGLDFTIDELLESGERICNVQKAFVARQGLTREDDDYSSPGRFEVEPVKDGECEGAVFERDVLLDDYYATRGWDVDSGLQKKGKLLALGLDKVAAELERVGALKP